MAQLGRLAGLGDRARNSYARVLIDNRDELLAELEKLSDQATGVAVPDLMGSGLASRLDDLVAGRQARDEQGDRASARCASSAH